MLITCIRFSNCSFQVEDLMPLSSEHARGAIHIGLSIVVADRELGIGNLLRIVRKGVPHRLIKGLIMSL